MSECKCAGTGWITVETDGNLKAQPCPCLKAKKAAMRLTQIDSRFRRFRDATYDTYIPRNEIQDKTKQAMIAAPRGSFWLDGDVRLGKTHLLVSQFRANVELDNSAVLLVTEDDLRQMLIREETRDRTAEPQPLIPWQRKEAFHLFLDDLGTVDKPTQFYLSALDHVIDEFYGKSERDWNNPDGFKLSVTSNLQIAAMRDRYGTRSVRRLEDMCKRAEMK